jgi:phosphoadenosine phosphosulfate reductase
MFDYDYDQVTGGIILNNRSPLFVNEPRPVYSDELSLFGFEKFWDFDCQNDYPYMWAEANRYVYYGRTIAKISGGSPTKPPVIEPVLDDLDQPVLPLGTHLNPIDVQGMVDKNKNLTLTCEIKKGTVSEAVWTMD